MKRITSFLALAWALLALPATAANEIRTTDSTGKTVYAVVLSGSQAWNTGTTAFATISSGSWSSYTIALTEQGTAGIYTASFPAAPAGRYSVVVYEQAGASASATLDTVIAQGQIDWSGSAQVQLSDVSTTVTGTNTRVTTALPSVAPAASGGLLTVGTSSGQISPSGGNVVASTVTGDVGGKVLGGGSGTITGDGVRAASVTGAVGSVTGSVGGNVSGSVGSVSGNVGGNVVGSVGSVSSGVQVASYATGQDPAALTWGATASSYNSAGTMGQKVNSAASAGDPWSTNISTGYSGNQAGSILFSNLNATITSRMASNAYTAPDNSSIGAIKAVTDKILFDTSSFVKTAAQTLPSPAPAGYGGGASGTVIVGGYTTGMSPAEQVTQTATLNAISAAVLGGVVDGTMTLKQAEAIGLSINAGTFSSSKTGTTVTTNYYKSDGVTKIATSVATLSPTGMPLSRTWTFFNLP